MMLCLVVVLVLTWVGVVVCGGVVVGGGVGSVCSAMCRCEGVGTQQKVNCVDVGLRSVPSDLSGLVSSLDVSMNELSELSADAFRRLPRLLELRLAGNSLTSVSKEVFRGLISLRLLTLQNNHLRTVPSEALKNLQNLRSLRLDANFISGLPPSSFRGLMSLRHLWLNDNVLTEVPVLALSTLTELQALTLALNNISSIPDRAFASLHRLLLLDLSFNRINKFPSAITHLKHLRELNLQNNDIRVVPENAFSGNPSIETINIQNNPLHSIGHSSFQLLPELQTLSLSGSITDFPDFSWTNRVETLSITGSHISILPDTICEELPNLHKLDLSNNLIQSLPSFSSCTKIKNIDLSSNRLSSVSLKSLQSLTHLKPPGHLKLRVSHQHQHRLRGSQHPVSWRLSLFLRCNSSSSSRDSGGLWTCGLDVSLFVVSIIFNLLLLLSSAPPPPSSQHLLILLLWFQFLAGLCASSIMETDSGSGLFWVYCGLCTFSPMLVVLKNRSWIKSCSQISSFALCFLFRHSTCFSSALMLFNTFCFLFMRVTQVTCHRHQEEVTSNLV